MLRFLISYLGYDILFFCLNRTLILRLGSTVKFHYFQFINSGGIIKVENDKFFLS